MKVQARITLPADVRQAIDELRIAWNPERALGNPAHITVAYHDEAPDPSLLAERLRRVAGQTSRFRLTVGTAQRFPSPVRGAYLAVDDPAGSVMAFREAVLTPPFTRRSRFGLHITMLHPDQGDRLDEAWPSFAAFIPPGSFEVHQIELVGPDNAVIDVFPLGD